MSNVTRALAAVLLDTDEFDIHRPNEKDPRQFNYYAGGRRPPSVHIDEYYWYWWMYIYLPQTH